MPDFFSDFQRACLLQWKLARWGLPWIWRRLLHLPGGRFSAGYRLRRVCEEMGVTYVKLGQYLAIRYDLLPVEICQELANLLNQVAPMDFATVRRVVETELNAPLETCFDNFAEEPVGAASIAQVHRATSAGGRMLAIKVQRPGVGAILETDIRNLRRIAWLADRFRLTGAISLVEVVDEVAAYTLREVDFIQEGRMADQIRQDSPPYVRVPEIIWNLTTRRVLSMEFIEGVSMLRICEEADAAGDNAVAKLLPGVDTRTLIDNLANACLRQLFITGRFHGDPHFANIIIGRDGRICFVDFGIFGSLNAEQRESMADLLAAMTAGLHEEAYRCYLRLARPTEDTDLNAYRRDMMAVLMKWHEVVADPTTDISEKLSVNFQTQVLQLMRRHRVRTEPDQILFWRTLGWLDVLANRVPGKVDLLGVMGRFFASTRPSHSRRFLALAGDAARIEQWADFYAQAPALAARFASRAHSVRVRISRRSAADAPARQIVLALVSAALALAIGAALLVR